jgi:hypothetical protein
VTGLEVTPLVATEQLRLAELACETASEQGGGWDAVGSAFPADAEETAD